METTTLKIDSATEKPVKFKEVLDHGVIELLDVMGDDAEGARAARISYGKYEENRTWEQDAKLIAYLHEHQHTSPFEMIELKWRVRAPVFVARQWLRHRTANVNEESRRYSEVPHLSPIGDLYYTPHKWRRASSVNKQSSEIGLPGIFGDALTTEYDEVCKESIRSYYRALSAGVSREQARMVLPQSMYTEFVWKNDLHNTLHFLKLRAAEDAQWEIQEYARAMVELMQERLPRLMEIVWWG